MNNYLLTLTPTDHFFFSQETKFRKEKNEIVTDYYQISAHFPQQTTLLGALRYWLLKRNGQIPIHNKQIAETLIGKSSFQITDDKLSFGKIESISPIFINNTKEHQYYFRNPKNIKKDGSCFTLKAAGSNYYLENYTEKEGLDNFLWSKNREPLSFDCVFKKNPAVGITKKTDVEAKEEAFYKQDFFKFKKKEFSFACIAQFSEDIEINEPFYITLGAEQNVFRVTAQVEDKNYGDLYPEVPKDNFSVTLTSDAFVANYKDESIFAICTTKTFRFLESVVTIGNDYYAADPTKKKSTKITRSQKFNLFEAGSVFYFENKAKKEQFIEQLNQPNFKTIGYNQYQ